jgi:hypothetical protein
MKKSFYAGVLVCCLSMIHVSFALPKFASRMGAKCQSCHVDPAGGGMRTEYGASYGREAVTLPTYKEATDLEEVSNVLNPNISIGTDVRNLSFYNQLDNTSSFFQMQADLYLDFKLNKKFQVYIDKGLYSDFQVMGIARVLPLNGYIKIGKFLPAYGTRVDDHTYFIRGGPVGGGPWAGLFPPGYPTGLRFGEGYEDTGFELGIAPSIFSFQAGVFDGTPGDGLTGVTGTKVKAVSARGDATMQLSDDINLNLGGSFFNDPDPSGTATFYGAFGAISFFQSLTLTSEIDFPSLKVPGSAQKEGLMIWHELNYMVIQGLDLKLGYEFYDPDRDIKNGSFSSIVVGAEFFVLTGVEIRPLYRFNMEQPTSIPNNEAQLMFHFFL